MSHMGEGNWALARDDRPVRLIKRPLGIGGLDDPPTFLFQYATGPVTLATLVVAGRRALPAAWSPRARSSTPTSCPALEMPYGFFRPDSRRARVHGRAGCASAARTTRCSTPGARRAAWRTFCELAGLEFAVA